MKWDKNQKTVIKMCENNALSMLYIKGRAGVGKSTLVKHIATLMKKKGWTVFMTAPTGKAAQILNGTTIHKWLEPIIEEDIYMNIKITGWKRDAFFDKECLVIDEASMLDNKVYQQVMKIFNNSNKRKKIILVGDTGQLPPVEGGTPFIDFIKNNHQDGVELKQNYRNKDGNDIAFFANNFRSKNNLEIYDFKKFKNVKESSLENAMQVVSKNTDDNQIIIPKRIGENGTHNVNQIIQKAINNDEFIYFKKKFVDTPGSNRKKKINDHPIYANDKIVITRNNWKFDIANGTTCIVSRKDKKKIKIFMNLDIFKKPRFQWVEVVWFKNLINNKMEFLPLEWLELNSELAYALTVHKFQGSQCNNVYFVVTQDQMSMLSQKMFYTGITRAQKMLYLVKKIN